MSKSDGLEGIKEDVEGALNEHHLVVDSLMLVLDIAMTHRRTLARQVHGLEQDKKQFIRDRADKHSTLMKVLTDNDRLRGEMKSHEDVERLSKQFANQLNEITVLVAKRRQELEGRLTKQPKGTAMHARLSSELRFLQSLQSIALVLDKRA
jgi:phage terminase large subunit-like protein